MSLVKKLSFPDNKFDLYFLAYDGPGALSSGSSVFDREGVIELTHNYGTEDDPDYKVNSGNAEPHRGFGHVCVSVDRIQAACRRLEDAGYRFQKRLTDGRMKNIAFALDPDGYWVEIISQTPGSKGADDPEEQQATTTDTGTYRMVSGWALALFVVLIQPSSRCRRDVISRGYSGASPPRRWFDG